MADLIDRAALLKAGDVTKMDVAFEDWNRLDNATKRHIVNYGNAVRRLVEAAPAVDAVEVVRAHWNDDGRCTRCGRYMPFDCDGDAYESIYCPDCGALMTGKVV